MTVRCRKDAGSRARRAEAERGVGAGGVRGRGRGHGGAQTAEGGGQTEEKVQRRALSADLKPTCGGKVLGTLHSG